MPSRRHITVTRDEELDAALARVRDRVPTGSEAELLRAMALRGVEATVADEQRRRALIERLIAHTTAPDWPPIDPEELRRGAWDIEHKLPPEMRARDEA